MSLVGLTWGQMLSEQGLSLVPVDSPEHFTGDADNPTATMVRQILGSVSQFEKTSLVMKLRKARDAKRKATGRCEGRKPYRELVPEAVALAKKLRHKNPHTHKRRLRRQITDGDVVVDT